MKAIRLTAPGILELQEIPIVPLKDCEIRIRVRRTSVCGSDLNNIFHPVLVPQTLGHEFSGEVTEVTEMSAKYFQKGDRVTAFPIIGCMECDSCNDRNFRDCDSKVSLGFQLPGSFAESIVVDSRFVIRLKEGISYTEGSMIEHLACGYRLGREIAEMKLSMDSHILILGDGPIALADLQSLRVLGYCNISLIGKHEFRKNLASKLGAENVLDSNTCYEDLEPVDVCVFAAKAHETLNRVVDYMKPQSIVFPQTRISDMKIEEKLSKKNIVWGRAFAYMLDDFYKVMDFILDNRINVNPLVTVEHDLFDLPALLKSIKNKGVNMKIMLVNNLTP